MKKETQKSMALEQDEVMADTGIDSELGEEKEIVLSQAQFDEVKARIDALQTEKDEAIDMAKRVQADFENFRRRNNSIRAESIEDGARETVTALLPVLDSFDKALEAAEGDDSPLAEGLRMTQRQLMDALQKLGLAEIEALDAQFDPMLHHAVLQEEVEGKESGTVVDVIQKGYSLKDKVIRYAMVKVAP